MKICISSPPLASDTAYGFELRYLDFARMLMADGITPHDLKEHYHDFEWVAKKVWESVDRQIKDELEDRTTQMETWKQFRSEDVMKTYNKMDSIHKGYCEKVLGDVQVIKVEKERR